MGFTDNVFDQKRGNRSSSANAHSSPLPGVAQISGRKRQTAPSHIGPASTLRKIEPPTPATDFASRHMSREGPDYMIDPQFGNIHTNGILPNLLPSMKTFPDERSYSSSPVDDRLGATSDSPLGMATLATAAVCHGRIPGTNHQIHSTLGPVLAKHILPRQPPERDGTATLSVSTTTTAIPTPPHNESNGSMTEQIDMAIKRLEEQIATLKKYEQEFLSLNLEDSHKMLSAQLRGLESELRGKKREKSIVLIEMLEREGFGGLADGVRREMAMWGGG